jgi:hypothetical protein
MGCEEDWRGEAMKWGKIEGERWMRGQVDDGADGRGEDGRNVEWENGGEGGRGEAERR